MTAEQGCEGLSSRMHELAGTHSEASPWLAGIEGGLSALPATAAPASAFDSASRNPVCPRGASKHIGQGWPRRHKSAPAHHSVATAESKPGVPPNAEGWFSEAGPGLSPKPQGRVTRLAQWCMHADCAAPRRVAPPSEGQPRM